MNAFVSLGSTTQYVLHEALLVYKQEGGRDSSSQTSTPSLFVTKHPIRISGAGAASLGPGSSLSRAHLNALLSGLKQHLPVEFLPPTVLIRTDAITLWWTPPMMRPMFYAKEQSDALGALSGKHFPQPALLFCVSGKSLAVRAVAGSERPTPTTPLLAAPYWNVYDSGAVCLGSMATPSENTIAALEQWEQAFFASAFTHPNTSKPITQHPGGFVGLWQSLVDQTAFPTEHLVDAGETVEAFAKKVHSGIR